MNRQHHTPETGFTLVEMSIVIVIVGLLIGGILVGSSLIRNSRLQSVISDVDQYISATQNFKDKYKYLPGDMPNATSFWGKDAANCNADPQPARTPGTCNGDGNEKIIRDGIEEFRYWQQLSLAGLIPGTFTGTGQGGALRHEAGINDPATKIDGAGISISFVWAMSGDVDHFDGIYRHTMMLGTHTGGSTYDSDPVLTQSEAYEIDLKMDDGKPAYGKVRTFKPVYSPCATTSVSSTAEYNNASAQKDTKNCSLLFITGY